jgi:hypothetical protein
MRTLCMLWLFVTLSSDTARADVPLDSTNVKVGITSVRSIRPGEDADSEILARVTVERPRKSDLARGAYWGAEERAASSLVTGLLVTVGGDTVALPFNAYGDLAEPKSILIERASGDFTIKINGGAGVGAYSAKLVIGSPLILRKRRVESLGLAHAAWEQTDYSQYRFYPKDFRP